MQQVSGEKNNLNRFEYRVNCLGACFMNSSYSILPASSAHAKIIANLAYAIWPQTYSFLPDGQVEFMLEAMYSQPALIRQMWEQNQQFLLLYCNNKPIGFASYTIFSAGKSAKLNKLYLLPEWHGKGLGKFLLTEVENQAVQAGCQTLLLNVNRHNSAFAFYKSLGFTISKEEDIPIGPFFMNDYVLEKTIG